MKYQRDSSSNQPLIKNLSQAQSPGLQKRAFSHPSNIVWLNRTLIRAKTGNLEEKNSETLQIDYSDQFYTQVIHYSEILQHKLQIPMKLSSAQNSSLEKNSQLDSSTMSYIISEDTKCALKLYIKEMNQIDHKVINITFDKCLYYIKQVILIYKLNQNSEYSQMLTMIFAKYLQRLFQIAEKNGDFHGAITVLISQIHKLTLKIRSSKSCRYNKIIQYFFDKQLRRMLQRAKHEASTLKFQIQDRCQWFIQNNLQFLIKEIYIDQALKNQVITTLKELYEIYENILHSKQDLIINQKKMYSILVKDNASQMAKQLSEFIQLLACYSQRQKTIMSLLYKLQVKVKKFQPHQPFFAKESLISFLQKKFINEDEYEIQLIDTIGSSPNLLEDVSESIEYTVTVAHRRLKYLIQLQTSLNKDIFYINYQQELTLPKKYEKFIKQNLQTKNSQLTNKLKQSFIKKIESTMKQIEYSQLTPNGL